MTEEPERLLAPDEPSPVSVYNERGRSPFLLVADHAGNLIPRALGRLGIAAAECERHIAWDIGIAGLGRLLAQTLDAMLIQQNYSRLVIDCNRPPGSQSSIAELSELTAVPGNVDLSEKNKTLRAREIFWPYHQKITAELDRRKQASEPTVLVALHSFTPVFKGVPRPWHAGVLYNRDARLAHSLLAQLKADPQFNIGDNEPYFVSDTTDYTIPVHGERRGLPHALIEVRQDLIAEEGGQRAWDRILGRALRQAAEELAAAATPGGAQAVVR